MIKQPSIEPIIENSSRDKELGISRKNWIKQGLKIGLKAIPIFSMLFSKKLIAQSTSTYNTSDPLANIFLFLYQLSNWQNQFYQGINSYSSVMGSSYFNAFQQIQSQESAQLNSISQILTVNFGIPSSNFPVYSFDYRARVSKTSPGAYEDYQTNSNTFLSLAQLIEDTSTRAFLGQMNLMVGSSLLKEYCGLMSIHSRQAAYIRNLRANQNIDQVLGSQGILAVPLKPWVSQEGAIAAGYNLDSSSSNTLPYVGESDSIQAQIHLININRNASIDLNIATESFDQPLVKSSVLGIINSFLPLV